LSLQIEREFPLPPEDLAWGFRKLNSGFSASESERSTEDVLVVAVRNEIPAEYDELFAAAGLTAEITVGALARASTTGEAGSASYSLLDIGFHSSELIVFEDGIPSSVRIFPWGGEHLTLAISKHLEVGYGEAETQKIQWSGGEANDAEYGEGIRQCVEAEVQKVSAVLAPEIRGRTLYLTGGTSKSKEITELFSRALGPSVACEAIRIPEATGQSAAVEGMRKAFENGRADGLILLENGKRKTRLDHRSLGQWRWVAAVIALLGAWLFLPYLNAAIQTGRLTRKLEKINAYQDALPSLERELSFLQYLEANQMPCLDAISVVADSAPRGMRLESFSLSRRGDLSFKGTLGNAQQLTEFRTKMIASGLFIKVVVDEQTPIQNNQKLVVKISAKWRKRESPHPSS
jgi:hypothetical protein